VVAFDVRIEGNARVLVQGELDMATAPQLSSALAALERTEAQTVVVDLHDVTFIDSTAISALCQASAALEARGAVLVLARTSPPVEAVLRIVGLDMEFVREGHE
jgi:anti-anti-sigma factor